MATIKTGHARQNLLKQYVSKFRQLYQNIVFLFFAFMPDDTSELVGIFRRKPNLNAKINFVTEKHLLDCIKKDRRLSQFGCVMMDEVHERTVNTDMCLGMMKIVLKLRPDMKLVSFSGTIFKQGF